MYDILIIGAGPAGLTAAIYAGRAGKSVLVLEKSTFGGQMTFSPKIENYPAFTEISGNDLADRMVEQALTLGAEIEPATVTSVLPTEEGFDVTADGEIYTARAVIIATGAEHRRLGLPGEEELVGHGISFCAVCDGAFYAGNDVAVVGGGNSAIVEASLLAESAKTVTVIQNLGDLTGEKVAADALRAKTNVRIIYNTVVTGYESKEGSLTALKLQNDKGEESRLPIDGVFLAVGLRPANEPFADVAELDKYGYVAAGENCAVNKTAGIFVAGDCRTKSVRQISTAAADGATAALAACRYIDSK